LQTSHYLDGYLPIYFGIPWMGKECMVFVGKYNQRKPKNIESGLMIEYRKEPPYETTEPAGSAGHALRYQRLKIKNITNVTLDNCIVKLEEMRPADGAEFNTAFLPVGLITQHQRVQGRSGGVFNLRACEEKFVEIACLDETNPESEIVLLYETNQYKVRP